MHSCHSWSRSVTILLLTNRDLFLSVGFRRSNWGERRTRWPRETRNDRIAWPHRAPRIYSKAGVPHIKVIGRQLWMRAMSGL